MKKYRLLIIAVVAAAVGLFMMFYSMFKAAEYLIAGDPINNIFFVMLAGIFLIGIGVIFAIIDHELIAERIILDIKKAQAVEKVKVSVMQDRWQLISMKVLVNRQRKDKE